MCPLRRLTRVIKKGGPSRATSLTNVSGVVNALLKNALCAHKFVRMLDRVLMKLEAKLVDLVGVKAKLFKGI